MCDRSQRHEPTLPETGRAHSGPSVNCERRPLLCPYTRGERLVVHFTTEYARQSGIASLTGFSSQFGLVSSLGGRTHCPPHPAGCCRKMTDIAIVRGASVLSRGTIIRFGA